jgi:hypothetical protein
MWSILVAIAARIHHLSRIHHDNGTLTHYRGLRDDGMPGHRGRGSTYDPSAPRSSSAGLCAASCATIRPARRRTIEATMIV